MDEQFLASLLCSVQSGSTTVEAALEALKGFPAETVPHACLDHQRLARTAIPEVIYGESKSAEQIIAIAAVMATRPGPLLATRIDRDKAEKILNALPDLIYHEQARMLTGAAGRIRAEEVCGTILIISAGTSDIPVAEEARLTVTALGHPVRTLYDVGVAGLHRLLSRRSLLLEASVIVVAAGMEGALPSVVAGLVSSPVIGVPTSVGYGAGIGGFAALLGMLNSCAPGVAVVNIDNGFGAGCMAAAINRARSGRQERPGDEADGDAAG